MRNLILKLLLRFVGDQEPGPRKKRVGSWILRNVPGMLTCAEVEEFVFDYYEGSLSEKQCKQFDMHLALCPMCRVHFDSYVRSVALGQLVFKEDSLPEEIPEELVGAILLAFEDERNS